MTLDDVIPFHTVIPPLNCHPELVSGSQSFLSFLIILSSRTPYCHPELVSGSQSLLLSRTHTFIMPHTVIPNHSCNSEFISESQKESLKRVDAETSRCWNKFSMTLRWCMLNQVDAETSSAWHLVLDAEISRCWNKFSMTFYSLLSFLSNPSSWKRISICIIFPIEITSRIKPIK